MFTHKSTVVLLSSVVSQAFAETIHGAVVFTRHGDRTSKHYSGYSLTNLGFEQNFQVGSSYRSRYLASDSPQQILNISEDKYVPAQIYASAPEQAVLMNTATAFLQGFYPPLGSVSPEMVAQTLNNGTTTESPLDGYQYVFLHGADANSPDTMWLKGDDGCPASAKSSKDFEDSAEFKARVESTKDFYSGFWDILQGVYDYTSEKLTYAKAYDIFDLINVANIHNSSLPRNVTSDELFQLRTLADSAEFGYNFNASDTARSIGGRTLAGAILKQLNQTVTSKGKTKFSLLAGSYDSFLAFFGISDLIAVSNDFFGLPDYASSMAFELFTPEDTTSFPTNTEALNVRFLFRNGTSDSLDAYPLFGRSDVTMSWAEFVEQMKQRAITSTEEWCQTCNSSEDFCSAFGGTAATSVPEKGSGGMSNAVAGVIGAVVTMIVIAIGGALAFVILRRRNRQAVPVAAEKASISSESMSA